MLRVRLAEHGSAERADGERRYLRSDLVHLGVRLPVLRRITRRFVDELQLGSSQRVALAEELWQAPVYELRQAAVQVLVTVCEELDATHLPLIERLVRQSRTWALVDPLATTVTGSILRRHTEAHPVLDRWIADPDFWVRRAALLAHLGPLRAEPGPETFAPFAAHADRTLDEREFFIRKAIGWVLREAGKRDPALVTGWLAPRTQRASGVTMREAVKYLPADDAERLMRAYRNRAPAAAPR